MMFLHGLDVPKPTVDTAEIKVDSSITVATTDVAHRRKPSRSPLARLKIGVLGSTRGTDLQAILDAWRSGVLNASVEVVISNKADAYILQRAKDVSRSTMNCIFLIRSGSLSDLPLRLDAVRHLRCLYPRSWAQARGV